MIPMDDFIVEGTFPAVITPSRPSSYDLTLSHEDFLAKLRQHKASLEQLLLKHGALLFRGFNIDGANHFASVIESLGLGDFVNYIGGDSPRDKVENKVYTSTEAPPDMHIPLHQELSFIKNHPRHIYFYCDIEPKIGGATIIADARRVYKALDPHVKQRFDENGLTYTSHYYHKSKIMDWVNRWQRSHKSWLDVFEATTKEDVEKKCIANEFVWRWLKRDWVEIQQTRPAVMAHPLTNETVWFNQAHLYDFNPKLLGWGRYIGAKLFYFQKSTRLHEIAFSDGSQIPRKDLYHILDVLKENTVSFPWKKGDVLVLDNILAMHGRATFSGSRRILTALTA
jgi:alpha-ketoglutarate-dependent taurine dioxygenase